MRFKIDENEKIGMNTRLDRPTLKYPIMVVLTILAVVLSLYLANFISLWFAPPWPILGLHGVPPALGTRAWGRVLLTEGGQGFNDWGQRDRQRTIKPDPGVKRIGFVGDSFVEESAPVPIPLAVENKIGQKNVEVVNFGVSATGTSDYYYRIKNIVIPLGVHEIFLFFYLGNDFSPDKLSTRLAIFSTYPKDSIASRMGLLALNHLVTNRHRNAIGAWQPGKKESLHDREEAMQQRFQSMDDNEIRNYLLAYSKFEGTKKNQLQQVLARKESSTLFTALRHPDAGLFRSYMFESFFHWVVGENYREDASTAEQLISGIYPRIQAMKQVCDEASVAFSLVLVPMGMHVDPRYRETWSMFGDTGLFGANRRKASQLFKDRLVKDGIIVHDLNDSLRGIRGGYLNVDGHWSQLGVDRVADVLSKIIRNP